MNKGEYYQSLIVALDQLTKLDPMLTETTPWSSFLKRQTLIPKECNSNRISDIQVKV